MSADASSNPLAANEVEQIPDAHHPAGVGLIKPGYDPALTNEDLAPLHKQNWSSYNIFAFWSRRCATKRLESSGGVRTPPPVSRS